jgi:NifU-like protein
VDDNSEQRAVVEQVIQDARPGIQRDGGDIELVSIANDIVRVRLSGACTHCSLAGQTLGNLRRQIVAKLARPLRVLPAPID